MIKPSIAFLLIFFQMTDSWALSSKSLVGCFGAESFVAAPLLGLGGFSPKSYLGVQDLEDVVRWMNKDYGPDIDARIIYEALTFNASAEVDGPLRIVSLNLGLILHPKISKDVIALIACHELGHHLAGAPWSTRSFEFSVEGQADFFAPQECFHHWLDAKVLSAISIRPEVQRYCSLIANRNSSRYENCNRTLEASVRLSEIFAEKRKSQSLPDLFAVDQFQVAFTLEAHSSPQCRLDTFKAGFISHIWTATPRPSCWFSE